MPRRSRAEHVLAEKGELTDHFTSGEFCGYLGVTPRRFREWRAAGKIPEPAARTVNGWGLWSPEQTRVILDKVLEKK